MKKLNDNFNPLYKIQKEGIDSALLEVSLKEPFRNISLAHAKESVKVFEAQGDATRFELNC